MSLTPEIAVRLQALQSPLESRDLELAGTVAIRLEAHRSLDGIGEIIGSVGDHCYAEASALIR